MRRMIFSRKRYLALQFLHLFRNLRFFWARSVSTSSNNHVPAALLYQIILPSPVIIFSPDCGVPNHLTKKYIDGNVRKKKKRARDDKTRARGKKAILKWHKKKPNARKWQYVIKIGTRGPTQWHSEIVQKKTFQKPWSWANPDIKCIRQKKKKPVLDRTVPGAQNYVPGHKNMAFTMARWKRAGCRAEKI